MNRSSPRRFVFVFVLLTIAGMALAEDVAARFPDPARVAGDYPDEAQRFVALNLLWDVSHAKVPTAVAQRSAYYNAASAIHTRHMSMPVAQAEAFNDQTAKFTADHAFRQSVLQRYQLNNLPDPPAGAAPGAPSGGTPSDEAIQMAFYKAIPLVLVTFFLMTLVARWRVRSSSGYSNVMPPLPNAASDGLALPEVLRVISLPLAQYCLEAAHGLAIEKETTVTTHYATTTTQGQVYSVGNQVYSTPGQTTTTSSTSQTDLIWIRTPDGRETSWTFSGGGFKVRPGHALSVITPPGGGQFLMAYNHGTGQFSHFGNGGLPPNSGGAWFCSTIVGTLGFGLAVMWILSIDPSATRDQNLGDTLSRYVGGMGLGGVAAALVAIWTKWSAIGRLSNRRAKVFNDQYVPGFRQYFTQLTPRLKTLFGI